jgi:hypothetical protein
VNVVKRKVLCLLLAGAPIACDGNGIGSDMSGCPAVIKPSILATVLSQTGQVATGEIIEITPLSHINYLTPAKYIVCGSPSGGRVGFPVVAVDNCENIVIGAEKAGAFTLRLLATDADPVEVEVPADECGVITQRVNITQGSFQADVPCDRGQVAIFCSPGSDVNQILIPSSVPGCNPELEPTAFFPLGDIDCDLMPDSCGECTL